MHIVMMAMYLMDSIMIIIKDSVYTKKNSTRVSCVFHLHVFGRSLKGVQKCSENQQKMYTLSSNINVV